jgi:hypothetical protein
MADKKLVVKSSKKESKKLSVDTSELDMIINKISMDERNVTATDLKLFIKKLAIVLKQNIINKG